MKKGMVSSILFVCATVFAAAQDVETCTNVPVSHWSVGLKGGAAYVTVAPTPVRDGDRLHLMLGGTVEYSINPLAGIGLELVDIPYGGDVTPTLSLEANTFDLAPYFSVNLSNLLFPYREGFWKKTNIFSEIGAGYGFYYHSLNNGPTKHASTMLAKAGINAEYNMNEKWALAIEGQYRYYDDADMGGAVIQKGNCEALTVSIGLRYKFNVNGKKHARNISMCEYYPKPAPVDDTKSRELYQDIQNRLKSAQDQQKALQQKALKLEQDIKDLSTQK